MTETHIYAVIAAVLVIGIAACIYAIVRSSRDSGAGGSGGRGGKTSGDHKNDQV
jgi:hypothetical protein